MKRACGQRATARASASWTLALTGLGAYAGYRLVQRLRTADLSGQVVLITGGSRGLGFMLAQEFARLGCRIAICGRNGDTLERARGALADRGADVLAVQCDVSDAAAVRSLIVCVEERYERIDVLVNNAGTIQVGSMTSVTEDDYRYALDLMFWGPLRTTLAALPGMRRRGYGRIVNITSIGGVISVPHLLPYSCAKFAAVGLSQGLHAELRREGIRVTTIVPGLMRVGSHLNVEFAGETRGEYAWFALGATLPGVSMSVARAARQIVRATQRGQALRILGAPACIAERLHGLMPGVSAEVMACVNALLPRARGSATRERGWQVEERMRSKLFQAVTALGESAARRTNQFAAERGVEQSRAPIRLVRE